MGRKRIGARQYLYLCVAGLIIVVLNGCAPIRAILQEREERAHLQRTQLLTRQRNYDAVLRENRKILSLSPKSPPGDAALYSMGLIFADPANPDKDYKQALGYFTQLATEFPRSSFAEESRIWTELLAHEVSAEREGAAHLQRMQLLIRDGNFEDALRENRKFLSLSPESPPGDAALYSMGLIFADPANPDKDYKQALGYFTQLATEFPRSSFAEESRIWTVLLEHELSAEREGAAHLQRMQLLIRDGNFEDALRENRTFLSLSPKSPPGDAALYSMGLISADPANPDKDYKQALGFFTQLVNEFPRSSFAEESRVWTVLLEYEVSAEREGRAHLQRMQLPIRRGNFEAALRENQKILSLSPKSPPGDAALYSMGLIHAHYANPKMDYKMALNSFMRLKKEFPGSPFLEESRIWIGVLETMENALRIDINVDEKKKELRR